MLQLSRLNFATSNHHKFKEASLILDSFDIPLEFFQCSVQEIQSDKISDIAAHKAHDAFRQCNAPVIVEDDALEISALEGFPGPYSSYVYKTLGNKGILDLLGDNREAHFHSVIAYCDGKESICFDAKIPGTISKTIAVEGWGYDPIFIPKGENKTFAEIPNKNFLSHRYHALTKFSSWFLQQL